METAMAAAGAGAGEILLTEEMVKEEEQLLEQAQKEEEKRLLSRQEQEAEAREACLARLKKLLHASNIYSQFLVERIEKQNAERAAKGLRRTGGGAGERRQLQEIRHNQQEAAQSPGRSLRRKEAGSAESSPRSSIQKRKGLDEAKDPKRARASAPNSPSLLSAQERKPLAVPSRSADCPEGQPSLFTGGVMRPYQIEGYQWLKVLYENGVNGILADEMGLGKTVQVIALVAALVESGLPGPYLVVAPLSTLPNWLSELQRFTPSLSVLLYHGTREERWALSPRRLAAASVVVTSYEVAMRDRARLAPVEWLLLVVDEAHRLKNFRCRLVRELTQYRAANRLLLTGTPLQNSLTELWALLHFLVPEIFDDLHAFESWFDMGSLSGANDEAARFVAREEADHIVATMQEILRPFLLRRTKEDVVLELPKKTELLVFAEMSPLQEKLYKVCMDRAFQVVAEPKEDSSIDEGSVSVGRQRRPRKPIRYVEPNEDDIYVDDSEDEDSRDSGISGSSSSSLPREERDPLEQLRRSRNPLMDLRKVCNHPYIFRGLCEEDDGTNGEHLVRACGKLRLLDCMLLELRKRGHKVLLFSQMCRVLDILEDYCLLRGFSYCRLDGSTHVEDRQQQMHRFNTDPGALPLVELLSGTTITNAQPGSRGVVPTGKVPTASCFLFLLSTRAGGLGVNLTGADTVVLYDSDWNPQCDLQAMDRCHRIGQTRPVLVYRLVTRGTVEQRMLQMAGAKRRLEKIIMQKGKFAKVGKDGSKEASLSPQELLELLQSEDHSAVINTGSSVLSRDDLDALLDRQRLATGDTSALNSKLFEVVVKNEAAIDSVS